MSETYEKNGIIYFKEPFKTDVWKWLWEHMGVDILIKKCDADFANDIVTIVAYSSDESYNLDLYDIALKTDGFEIVKGIYNEEVFCID